MQAVMPEHERSYQRTDRPRCIEHHTLMVCYASKGKGAVLYYRCDEPDCNDRTKVLRREVSGPGK